jgi:hypothetical protein
MSNVIIANKEDILIALCAEDEEKAKRNIYKYTACGAWIEFLKDGIRIGSIVEGSDFDATSHELTYPFKESEYDEVIESLEKETSLIWEWANTERENGKTDAENGLDFPLL